MSLTEIALSLLLIALVAWAVSLLLGMTVGLLVFIVLCIVLIVKARSGRPLP